VFFIKALQDFRIYIFTSGRVIVTVQIHSRKKLLKGVKMTIAKSTSIQERSRSYAILAEDLMERDVCSCGVEML
jgi:hypothetical protein